MGISDTAGGNVGHRSCFGTICQFFKGLNEELAYDPGISLQGKSSKETKTYLQNSFYQTAQDCTWMFTAALSPIQKMETQCPLTDKGVCIVSVFLFFFFGISWAAPVAYGGSQARGRIRAVAASLARATATRDPSRVCNLHHSPRQRRIVNPLSKGRDRTRNLMVPSRIR